MRPLPTFTVLILLLAIATVSLAQLSPDLIMETYNNNINAITSANLGVSSRQSEK